MAIRDNLKGGSSRKLYDALQFSGLVTEDMTYNEMCEILKANFPEAQPYHVVFTDYPITKTGSGSDNGTGTTSTNSSGYTMSVKKDPNAGGYGYVRASITLPTKGCNKVEISYTFNNAADVQINDLSVITNNTDSYTFDCSEDTFTLNFYINEHTGNNTATLSITDIYFYREVEQGGGSGGNESGGVTFNIHYGDTAPEDTSMLWCKCSEPSSVLAKKNVEGTESIRLSDTHLPTGCESICSATIGTKVYLFGGYTGNSRLNTINVFDTETETITTLSTTLPTACNSICSATIGTKVYLFGGCGSQYLNKINVFDTETETITTLSTTLPTACSYMGSATIGTKVYLFGGYTGNSRLNTINVFDTETETITTLSTTLPTVCNSMGSATIGTKVYLFGGYGSQYLNTINVFDTETETITTLSTKLPTSGSNICSATIGTKVYLFGGSDSNGAGVNTISVFDIEKSTITTLSATLPTKLSYIASATIGTKVYLFGGTGYLNTINVFTVQSELSANTLLLQTDFINNTFEFVDGIEIGVKNVYLGNSENIAEKVDAYLHNGEEWVQI